MSDRPLLALRNVSKVYSHRDVRTRALDGVSLDCAAGEFLVLRGPSGCGKSTLLSIMGMIDNPTSGEVRIGGVSAERISDAERARVRRENFGYVFQNYNLIAQLTALENVVLPLRLQRAASKSEQKRRAALALAQVGMDHRCKHFPDQLSGGQQQRVCVARALVSKPKVIFADEPTGNLDQSNGDAVMELLSSINREGTSVVLVTHEPRYERLGSRILRMEDGRISDESVASPAAHG